MLPVRFYSVSPQEYEFLLEQMQNEKDSKAKEEFEGGIFFVEDNLKVTEVDEPCQSQAM